MTWKKFVTLGGELMVQLKRCDTSLVTPLWLLRYLLGEFVAETKFSSVLHSSIILFEPQINTSEMLHIL